MKKLSRLILMLLAVTIAGCIHAEDFKKTFKERYEVEKDALLFIDNRFGDVTCTEWDESAVEIEVVITIDATSQNKIDYILSKIDIDLSGSRDKVSGITTMGSMRGSNSFSIDYFVKMPKTLTVDLSNKYGDLIMGELEGKSKITVKYGNFIARKLLNEDNKIHIEYSDDNSIEYVRMADINISYSEMDIERAEELTISSKYNEIGIEEVIFANINSGYDEYQIENAGAVIINSNFTELGLENLEKNIEADMNYGDLSVDRVSESFEKIKVAASYTDIELEFAAGAAYMLSLDESFTDVDLPSGGDFRKIEKSYTSSRFEGSYGGRQDAQGQVVIQIKHGSVSIE